nr:hypothetical protein CFP56_11759 [Quercus suber]
MLRWLAQEAKECLERCQADCDGVRRRYAYSMHAVAARKGGMGITWYWKLWKHRDGCKAVHDKAITRCSATRIPKVRYLQQPTELPRDLQPTAGSQSRSGGRSWPPQIQMLMITPSRRSVQSCLP